MPRLLRRSVLLCDMAALLANYAAVCAALPRSAEPPFCVLKANAYGHGAAAVAAALYSAGVRRFATSEIDEALELADLLPGATLLVLGYTPPDAAPYAAERGILLSVASTAQAKEYARRVRHGRLGIHAKLNSGMNRTGFPLHPAAFDASVDAVCRLAADDRLSLLGVYSHLATADEGYCEATARQLARWRAAISALAWRGITPTAHLSASAGIALGGLGTSASRVGLALFGYSPSEKATIPGLRPVGRLVTAIGQIYTIPRGEYVGYGATFHTERRTRLGVLSLGYADGLPRAATGATVRVGGIACPIVGRVSMDAATVLLDGVAGEPRTATVFGDTPHDLYRLAATAGTIPYEILSRLGTRIDRKYFYERIERNSDPQ